MSDTVMQGWDLIFQVTQDGINTASFVAELEGITPGEIDEKEETYVASARLQATLHNPQISLQSPYKKGASLTFVLGAGTLDIALREEVSIPVEGLRLVIYGTVDMLQATTDATKKDLKLRFLDKEGAVIGGRIDGLKDKLPAKYRPAAVDIQRNADGLISEFIKRRLVKGVDISLAKVDLVQDIPDYLFPRVMDFTVLTNRDSPGDSVLVVLASTTDELGIEPEQFITNLVPTGDVTATAIADYLLINNEILPRVVKSLADSGVDIAKSDFRLATAAPEQETGRPARPAELQDTKKYKGQDLTVIRISADDTRFDFYLQAKKEESFDASKIISKVGGVTVPPGTVRLGYKGVARAHVYLTPYIAEASAGYQSVDIRTDVPKPDVSIDTMGKILAGARGVYEFFRGLFTGDFKDAWSDFDIEHSVAMDLRSTLRKSFGGLSNLVRWQTLEAGKIELLLSARMEKDALLVNGQVVAEN